MLSGKGTLAAARRRPMILFPTAHNRPEIRYAWRGPSVLVGKLLSVAERISPKLLDLQQTRQGFEQQKTDWPKDADAPHDLAADDASRGGAR